MSFADDLLRGENGEDAVHNYMRQWYDVEYATPFEQRQGLDATYTNQTTGESHTVEVKVDEVAGRTGNVFIETISVDYPTKAGWVWTCQADQLIYWLPRQRLLIGFELEKLQLVVRDWVMRYKVFPVANDGYLTYGVAVPLKAARTVATWDRLIE